MEELEEERERERDARYQHHQSVSTKVITIQQKQKAWKSCGCEGDLRSGARRRGHSYLSPSGELSSRRSRGFLKGSSSSPCKQRGSTIQKASGSLDHQGISITRCSMLCLVSPFPLFIMSFLSAKVCLRASSLPKLSSCFSEKQRN